MPKLMPCVCKISNNGEYIPFLKRLFSTKKTEYIFKRGVIYGTVIQDNIRYVITREHEPIAFEENWYRLLFKGV